jgi:hypothetical protein
MWWQEKRTGYHPSKCLATSHQRMKQFSKAFVQGSRVALRLRLLQAS